MVRVSRLAMATAALWLPLALCGGLAGCRRQAMAPLPPSVSDTPVVAVVAGTPIHAGELVAQMRRQGVDARRALDELVAFEVMAASATASGAAEMAGVRADSLQAIKVQRLVEREIEPRLAPAAIEEAEIRAVYERGKSRFVHGRLVEVAVLCLFTGARMKPEPRARVEQNARQLKAFVDAQGRVAPTDAGAGVAAFEAIAREPSWVERKVSFTKVWQGDDRPFPSVVGRAALALNRPGQTTDLVGDETGYYIARYVSERPPEDFPFVEAAPRIREEMYDPWRRQRFLQLTLAMAQGHDIEVFPENFPLLKASDGPTPKMGTTAPASR